MTTPSKCRGYYWGAASIWLFAALFCLAGGNGFAADAPFGWRVGPAAWCFRQFSFFEAIDKTAALGLTNIEACQGQQVRADAGEKLDADLPDEIIGQIHAKLEQAKVKLTSIYIHQIPGDEAACRRTFDFARKLGAEFIVSEPEPEALDLIERHCNEYGINLAIHNHPEGSSRYWNPEEVLRVCEGRGPRIGACADTGHWLRSGLNPIEGIRMLGERIVSLHLKDLDKAAPGASDVPWGKGCGEIAAVLGTLLELRLEPALIAIEYEADPEDNMAQILESAQWYEKTVSELAATLMRDAPLFVGWASANIDPPKPVALAGQKHKRLAKSSLDPLTVTALALETRGPDGQSAQAVLLSCDLVHIPRDLAERLREAVAARAPGLDPVKIMLNATHTHTAPVLGNDTYKKVYEVGNEPGEMLPSEYCDFFLDRAAGAVAEAWQNREPGGMSWALGHAAVGINRRAQFADGTTVMYGKTGQAGFRGFEGATDTGVEMLFFWKPDAALTGVLINVACPAQETESLRESSADYWHDVRREIRRRHGQDLFILPQCAAAGDISPHRMFRKDADAAMLERRGLSHRELIAQRIANAVDEVLPTADADIKYALPLIHDLVELDLPEVDPPRPPFGQTDSVHPIRFHVLRIGEVAMAGNPFELYLDYGFRIKARSCPVLTFLVQLSDASCGYLPTAKAVAGGGYSAEQFVAGPEGGQVLVEETVRRVNYLWPASPAK